MNLLKSYQGAEHDNILKVISVTVIFCAVYEQEINLQKWNNVNNNCNLSLNNSIVFNPNWWETEKNRKLTLLASASVLSTN